MAAETLSSFLDSEAALINEAAEALPSSLAMMKITYDQSEDDSWLANLSANKKFLNLSAWVHAINS